MRSQKLRHIDRSSLPCALFLILVFFTFLLSATFASAETTMGILVGDQVGDIAVNPKTNTIYVYEGGPLPIQSNLCSAASKITVIDGSTNEVVDHIDIDHDSRRGMSLAFNPTTNILYAGYTAKAGYAISLIDASNNKIISTTPVQSMGSIAINENTNMIFQAVWNPGSVVITNSTTNIFDVTSIRVGDYPSELATNPKTNKAYVVSLPARSLYVIDGYSLKLEKVIPIPDGPNHVTVNPRTNMIYTANSGDYTKTGSAVSVIDGTSNNLIGAIQLDKRPSKVYVHPSTNTLYVFSYYTKSVTVVDASTHNVISTFELSGAPQQFAANPNTGMIYLTTPGIKPITIINTSTNTFQELSSTCPQFRGFVSSTIIAGTIKVGDKPRSIAGNPTTNTIYVANHGSNFISVIDGSSNTVTHKVTGIKNSLGVAVNTKTNMVYVTDASSDSLAVIDGSTNNLVTNVKVGDTPDGVAVNTNANVVYVGNFWSHSISVIDGSTNTVITTLPVGKNPSGIAVNSITNKVYVSSTNQGSPIPYSNDLIYVIDGSKNVMVASIEVGNDPHGLAINPNSNLLYVANYYSNTVSVIDTQTNKVIDTIVVDYGPLGIAINEDTNTVYVANSISKTISVIDGTKSNIITSINLDRSPEEVAVNPRTNMVYVTSEYTDSVSVIDGSTNKLLELGPAKPSLGIDDLQGITGDSKVSDNFGATPLLIAVAAILVIVLIAIIASRKKNERTSLVVRERFSTQFLGSYQKEGRYADEKVDMDPRSWLSTYRQTSMQYLLKMGLFYSGLGLVVAYSVFGIQYFLFDYEEPSSPISLVMALTAGPIEETLFFGLPFSLTGNHFVILGTGTLWALAHLFDPAVILVGKLSYSTFAFTIPYIFFSLRTWKSGKGWFAILFHSLWDAIIFAIAVIVGENPLMIVDTSFYGLADMALIILSAILLAITYPLYRWRIKREAKKHSEQTSNLQ